LVQEVYNLADALHAEYQKRYDVWGYGLW
jgi:hypothetical protein